MFRRESKICKLFSFLLALLLSVLDFSSLTPLSPVQEVSAQADINLATSTNGGTVSLISRLGTPEGSLGDTVDENSGTYYRVTRSGIPCCDGESRINCIANFTEEITLASLSTVNRIEYDIDFQPVALPDFPFADEGLLKDVDIFVYRAGSWIQVVTDASSKGSVSGPWLDVEGVKISVYINVQYICRMMCGAGCLDLVRYGPLGQLNEIKVWGFPGSVAYQDIGLRVQTPSGIVSIAAEIGAPTSPLRIAKNGAVYGIALVNPGDVKDSGVRIQTASGLQALRKL